MTGDPIKSGREVIYPRSRTFIRALVDDNPYYAQDHRYRSVLQSLPEPLRSMMLYGDFSAASSPDPFQVIPTAHVQAAQKRWMETEKPADVPLVGAGVDAARGGADFMTLSTRYDNWFDEVNKWPGVMVKDGETAAALVQNKLGGTDAYINVDVIGVGSSTYDHLKHIYGSQVRPVNASEGSVYRDRSRKLKMRNVRAEMYWRMRDALDPEHGDDVALPNDPELLADLCSARYLPPTSAGVLIEEKAKIKERISRSPDVGEAVLLCNYPSKGRLNVY